MTLIPLAQSISSGVHALTLNSLAHVTGAAFDGLIVIPKPALSESATFPSITLYVNASLPKTYNAGLKIKAPVSLSNVTLPCCVDGLHNSLKCKELGK